MAVARFFFGRIPFSRHQMLLVNKGGYSGLIICIADERFVQNIQHLFRFSKQLHRRIKT